MSYQEFVASLKDLNKKSIPYLVSYDGRTGEKQYGQALPLELELQLVELHAGRSSQATLLGRNAETFESLYLSPALLEKLAQRVPPETLQQPLHF